MLNTLPNSIVASPFLVFTISETPSIEMLACLIAMKLGSSTGLPSFKVLIVAETLFPSIA